MLAGSPERPMIIRFKKVTVVLQTPEVDLLASRLNYQISNRLSGHLELKHQNHVFKSNLTEVQEHLFIVSLCTVKTHCLKTVFGRYSV